MKEKVFFFLLLKDYVSTEWLSYLFVFFEGGLRCTQVDFQLLPPVLFLGETGLEQSQSLMAAVSQLFGTGPQQTFTNSVRQGSNYAVFFKRHIL